MMKKFSKSVHRFRESLLASKLKHWFLIFVWILLILISILVLLIVPLGISLKYSHSFSEFFQILFKTLSVEILFYALFIGLIVSLKYIVYRKAWSIIDRINSLFTNQFHKNINSNEIDLKSVLRTIKVKSIPPKQLLDVYLYKLNTTRKKFMFLSAASGWIFPKVAWFVYYELLLELKTLKNPPQVLRFLNNLPNISQEQRVMLEVIGWALLLFFYYSEQKKIDDVAEKITLLKCLKQENSSYKKP